MPFDILSVYLIRQNKVSPHLARELLRFLLSWQIHDNTVVTDLSINILSVG